MQRSMCPCTRYLGVWGMPPENFCILDSLRLFLMDSQAYFLAIVRTNTVIHTHMHLIQYYSCFGVPKALIYTFA